LEGISKDDAFRVQQEIETVSNKIISALNDAAEKKHQVLWQWSLTCGCYDSH